MDSEVSDSDAMLLETNLSNTAETSKYATLQPKKASQPENHSTAFSSNSLYRGCQQSKVKQEQSDEEIVEKKKMASIGKFYESKSNIDDDSDYEIEVIQIDSD